MHIDYAQEQYHTDTLVIFNDVTYEEEIKIHTYPFIGYDTLYSIKNGHDFRTNKA